MELNYCCEDYLNGIALNLGLNIKKELIKHIF